MMGLPSHGKSFTISGISIARIAGVMIVEHWGIEDANGMMQQLGHVPTE